MFDNRDFVNKTAKQIEGYKEACTQAQIDFNTHLHLVNKRQKAILINAMQDAKDGKTIDVKVIFKQLTSK
jgi:hypothetical protein